MKYRQRTVSQQSVVVVHRLKDIFSGIVLAGGKAEPSWIDVKGRRCHSQPYPFLYTYLYKIMDV